MDLRLAGQECLICILVLGFILYKLSNRDGTSDRLFRLAVWGTLLYCIMDFLWVYVNSSPNGSLRRLNLIINAWADIQVVQMAFCWMLYVQRRLQPMRRYRQRERLLYALPLLVEIGLALLSIKTGWYFSVDANNACTHGSWHFIHFIIAYGYVLASFVQPLLKALRENDYARKQEYWILTSFVVLPLLGGTVEACYPDWPATGPAVMLSLAWIYVRMQEHQVSVDALTQLNNRWRLRTYLSQVFQNKHDKSQVYLIMIDVDSFKQINDVHGHIVGDLALQQVARRLSEICSSHRCFLARYAGDEFIIVYEGEAVAVLMEDLSAAIPMQDEVGALTLSSGYALYNEILETVEAWITAADERMYVSKQAKKFR